MKIEINKAITKTISKSKKLELWEQIYLMVEELKEKTDLRYLECELKRAEKELKKFKEKIAELKKKLGDLYNSISEETKVSSFKSNDMTYLFKNIKIDDLDLSSMDTTCATNMNKIDSRYLERKKNLMKKEIKKLKEKIAELENEIKPIWFVPEKDENFFYVDTYGNVQWKITDLYSNDILKHNQVFKTKEEALDYLDYKRAEVSIKKRIAELNEGWRPDWEDESEDKFYVFYDTNTKFLIWCHALADKKLPDAMYLKSWKLAKQLIDELEEELKLYLRY